MKAEAMWQSEGIALKQTCFSLYCSAIEPCALTFQPVAVSNKLEHACTWTQLTLHSHRIYGGTFVPLHPAGDLGLHSLCMMSIGENA